MMWWAVWCAAMVAGSVFTAAAPPTDSIDLMQMDPSLADDESLGFAMQSLSGRYAAAPWLYLLADVSHDPQVRSEMQARSRRSFSVNPAVDTLQRGAYNHFLEKVVQSNRDYLNRIGKRDSWKILTEN
ncbi:diuretic hormone 41 isoform X7 [Bombyx mori]|nr:diuretic hormone 41 isoform DH34 precursor [Bombyx mori]BAG50374.1 diuretic hormone 34 [Bombyx mori]